MAPYDSAGKIPRKNFLVASIFLFVLSVLFTIGRILIRLRYQKKSLAVDDVFLIFAVVCLTAALGLLLAFISSMYLVESLVTNDPNAIVFSDILERGERFHKLSTVFNVLIFTTIFAVKFSFLFLFKALIRNVGKMSIYWWTVVLITTAAWASEVIEFLILCPGSGHESHKCTQESKRSTKILGWSFIAEDILTDLMIIVIPVLLLWRVQIKLQQKLALGLSLCLSLIMIITAIVKASGIYTGTNTKDATWRLFWSFMEACIAVIMVSLTAFRSLFVAHGSGVKNPFHKPSLQKRLLNSRIAIGSKQVGVDDGEETKRLPEIPGATLTGMRSFIQGKQAERSVMTSGESGDAGLSWPLGDGSADQTIKVQLDKWQKSENASSHNAEPSVHQIV